MNKNHLLSFSYTQREFPSKMINHECMQDSHLLFEEEASFSHESHMDLSNSFVVENDNIQTKKHGLNNNLKPKTVVKKGWRNVQEDNNKSANDTIDFLAGNNNKSKIEKFIKGEEKNYDQEKNMSSNVEDNFYGETSREENIKLHPNDTMVNDSKENISEYDMSQYNEHFRNSQSGMNVMMMNRPYPTFPGIQIPYTMIPVGVIPKTEKIKIENIFLFNMKNKIPDEMPLWYISMPWSPVLNGPLSSIQVMEMYNKHSIDSNWTFRPLDIFQFRRESENKMVNLTRLNQDDWAEEIQDSSLLRYTELFNTSKKLLESDNENKQVKERKKSEENKLSANNKNSQTNIKNNDHIQKLPAKENTLDNFNNIINTNNYQTYDNVKSPSKVIIEEKGPITQILKQQINDTLQLTTTEINNNFLHDTQVKEETFSLDIGKQIDDNDGEWEKVDKKKKKQKEQEPSFYLATPKPKNDKKENKPTQKIDIIPSEDLVKNLMPKHLKPQNKPDYEAFNAIGNSDVAQKKNNNNGKKIKGKPLDLDVKLGFKI
jgi:hypothetical protein